MTETTPLQRRQEAPDATPPQFPVTWADPQEAGLHWTFDRMHAPDPIPPLIFSIQEETFPAGWTAAAQSYALPVKEMRIRRINTYLYSAVVPLQATPEALAERGKESEERLKEAMARLADLWEEEWLPPVKDDIRFWEQFDLQEATTSHLLAHLEETLQRRRKQWEIHFKTVFPAGLAVSLFEEFFQDLFPDEDRFAAYHLLEGFESKPLQRDRALWQLSRQALKADDVRRVLTSVPASEVHAALEDSDAGRVFLAQLRTFLDEYGYAGTPPWKDDPAPVFGMLREYVQQPERDMQEELSAVVAERERYEARCREQLQRYPAAAQEQFEFLLEAARQGNVLHEEHAYWLDERSPYYVQTLFMEFGRRFARASAIDEAADVHYLTVDEVRETARALPDVTHHDLVQERKAEMAHFARVTPPPSVGTPPQQAPPDTPFSRLLDKFWGTPPPAAETSREVLGHAGAPGTVRGAVRILRTPAEAHKLEAGDVLVAQATTPPWTPLFATAAAVVTDTGGILSHTACVAREYRIPAVVGAVEATRVLQDGQMIEVDGDEGIVRILHSQQEE
jgi:pyruvate,water dikinase